MKETFFLPDFSILSDLPGINTDKIVVISIVGKSASSCLGLKVKSIGRLFTTNTKNIKECAIEGSYDEENQILYLHLHSLFDTDILIKYYKDLVERCQNDRDCSDDFLAVNDEIKSSVARALLLLFHASHIVILSHPGSTFDTSYIQYFKAVDNLSQKILTKIADSLVSVSNISREWIANGRFCTPRLIFYFERCPSRIRNDVKRINIKKIEHNLEDRIYHILKKTRIISNFNASSASLFAIPMNEEFVFISSAAADDANATTTDRLGDAVRGLILDCQPGGAMQVAPPFCNQSYAEKSFAKFLQVHVQQARDKGFNDTGSSSRHQLTQPAHFEIPILKQWIDSTKLLYEIIIKNSFINALCTDTRFSEQRCLKVLPLALAQYQEGLPSHYARAEHETRLTIALALFRAQARGPIYHKYAAKLERDCTQHWENGRQQCECASMTGNPCKLPVKHALVGDQQPDHISGFVYKAVCDCGRKVGAREDPYNAKQANYLFYQQISCCCTATTTTNKLERINFPVFEPSIKEYKAATLNEAEESTLSVLSDRSTTTDLTEPDDHHGTERGSTGNNNNGMVIRRQPSTTEYLPGMLTLNSPPGLLPVYSSWSLVCLGPSSLYSHNLGLSESNHPGFLSSTNYLLPWDVTVYSKAAPATAINKTTSVNWSHVCKYSSTRGGGGVNSRRGRGSTQATTQATSQQPQFSVKVFIGVEYECASGHRFMLAAPDKMLKATPGSIVKDTGHKITESDMPLYYPCVCRTNKFAQLMRLHVVTPKAPVNCTLNPKVQPAPGAPIFISTVDGPTKLTQSAYWIMRLPYVYVADKEHFKQNSAARLLQGVFGVTEIE